MQWKINRGRHTDHPAGRHSIRTNQCPPPPSSPYFLRAGCSSCCPTNSVKALKATSAFGLGRRRYRVLLNGVTCTVSVSTSASIFVAQLHIATQLTLIVQADNLLVTTYGSNTSCRIDSTAVDCSNNAWFTFASFGDF